MATISQQDFISSISDALRYIAYYHPPDFIHAMHQAYEKEQSIAAKDAIGQILINSRMCAEGQRPICQDTGIINVFLKVGMNIHWNATSSIEEMVNQAVHDVYSDPLHPLRASIVSDPDGARTNTGDNTPAVIYTELVTGDYLDITIAAKGGGSENKARFTVLNPGDDVVAWVLEQVTTMGAGWCPPGILGIGIGGTAEKALLMAKESLMEPINIHELKQRGPSNHAESLRLELYDKVNELGIGAQGLGGLTTVLDVKVKDYPTHASSKPVAIIPNCAATRHIHFRLDGTGPVQLTPPKLSTWPRISLDAGEPSIAVDIDHIDKQQTTQWKAGDRLLISGKILTARDAAHKRIVELLAKGEALPGGLDFTNRFVYYVGPVAPSHDEVVGPAGPTTATRMDKFTEPMLSNTGLLGMIGKAERGDATINSIKQHQSVYLIATGGAAYLISQSIKKMHVVAFPELGMEAVYEFEVEDMPVTVAVDSQGNSVHKKGPQEWRIRIEDIKKGA